MTSGGPLPPGDGGDERLGTLAGDRVCTGCGYSLAGQLIVREPHYRLVIVRCPECGTVAGVQEYPLLGRWAQRWGLVLAGLWLVVIVAAWPATSGIMTGFSTLAVDVGTRTYFTIIDQRSTAEMTAAAQAAAATSTAPPPSPPLVIAGIGRRPIGLDFELWWAQQDPAALLAAAGGLRGAIDWRAAWTLLPALIILFLIGAFWSIALLHWPRRRLFVALVLIVGLAALFSSIFILGEWRRPPRWAWDAARAQLGPAIMVVVLALLTVPLALGLLFGRPCARLAARALLAPRARSALAPLWTAEGLPPPRPRR
jgi:hypothetical protein